MYRPNPTVVTSGPLPYMVSQPAPVDLLPAEHSTAGWPVLCFLHGYDEGYPTPIEQGLTRHGPFKAASSAAATGEFVVVAPQLPTSGDFWHRYDDEVRMIVEHVQKEYGGDPQRTFLTGFSFGGNGVFDLGLKKPDFWRALWPVDPTRVPNADPQQPIWLSSGQISRRQEDRFLQRLHLERLRPEHSDEIVPGDRIYLDQMQDHVGTASQAYQDDRIYRWLLAH
jgi:predicted peptidase